MLRTRTFREVIPCHLHSYADSVYSCAEPTAKSMLPTTLSINSHADRLPSASISLLAGLCINGGPTLASS